MPQLTPSKSGTDRPLQFSLLVIFLVTTAAAMLFAHPIPVLSVGYSLAAAVLGLCCIRAAVTNRVEGWVSGLIFGSAFAAIGTIALVLSLVFIVSRLTHLAG